MLKSLSLSVGVRLSCPGVSDVAARPTERCTALFPTAPPLTVSTPPTNPTTAAPSVRLVSRGVYSGRVVSSTFIAAKPAQDQLCNALPT